MEVPTGGAGVVEVFRARQSFAIAATFAAVAVGAAAPASAAPVVSGHYVKTETATDGRTSTDDWYFTPCGDGCADVTAGGGTSPAQLANGQWTVEGVSNAGCADGTQIAKAETVHYTWDANTLAGTVQGT